MYIFLVTLPNIMFYSVDPSKAPESLPLIVFDTRHSCGLNTLCFLYRPTVNAQNLT